MLVEVLAALLPVLALMALLRLIVPGVLMQQEPFFAPRQIRI
jgi:hypothetical protein